MTREKRMDEKTADSGKGVDTRMRESLDDAHARLQTLSIRNKQQMEHLQGKMREINRRRTLHGLDCGWTSDADKKEVKTKAEDDMMRTLGLPFRRPRDMHRVSMPNMRESRKDECKSEGMVKMVKGMTSAKPGRIGETDIFGVPSTELRRGHEELQGRMPQLPHLLSDCTKGIPISTRLSKSILDTRDDRKSEGKATSKEVKFEVPRSQPQKSSLIRNGNGNGQPRSQRRSSSCHHPSTLAIIGEQIADIAVRLASHPCFIGVDAKDLEATLRLNGPQAEELADTLETYVGRSLPDDTDARVPDGWYSAVGLLGDLLAICRRDSREQVLSQAVARTSSEKELGSNDMEKSIQGLEASPEVPSANPWAAPTEALPSDQYAQPFCDFLTSNPTVFHAVHEIKHILKQFTYRSLSERDTWDLKKGGRYFVERNGSSLIAFTVGDDYEAGNGAAILAGHVDALTAKLKPISKLQNKAGYVQLGVAPYAGALNSTWWDRDLGVGGRVLVKTPSGKIESKLVKLDRPIARIPTLAPHFGAAANGPFNQETQMVPIIGLDNSDIGLEQTTTSSEAEQTAMTSILGGAGGAVGQRSFASTQPLRLVSAITKELGIKADDIVNWELELFDTQPATLGGLDSEFIYAGRIDDKLCSWAAVQALLQTTTASSGIIKVVGLFDDEEIGSLLRQGARSNFLPDVLTRISESFASPSSSTNSTYSRMCANSFLVSSDVTHAVNPNFLSAYLENHTPRLNVGLTVTADSNGHMTTDAVSTAILQRCAELSNTVLQVFQIRNDSRSGGTVGPMLSAKTGIRSIDAGLPQLSMHSIRATTGSLDPGLGVKTFQGFLEHFEKVDQEFRDIA